MRAIRSVRGSAARACGLGFGGCSAAAGFGLWGSTGLLEAVSAGAWAWAGGAKVVFWALWQARVDTKLAAKSAERMMAGYELEENLIFSKTYPKHSGARLLLVLILIVDEMVLWQNSLGQRHRRPMNPITLGTG